jgi:poly-gamma-glutamate synthesis protein (capsule biosynthesis protein)
MMPAASAPLPQVGLGGHATIAFIGDMLFNARPGAPGAGDPQEVLGDVLPVLRAADAVFANLEAPVTAVTQRWPEVRKLVHMRAVPSDMALLSAANIRYVNLANNHILDYGPEGLAETLRHLDAAGIAHTGAGPTAADAARPAVVSVAGASVGVLSLTDTIAEFAAGPDRPGACFHRIGRDPALLQEIETTAADLHRDGAGLVVLSLHWGPNFRRWPSRNFRAFAHAALDRGVDVIHGHSAHFVHGMEVRGRRLILYDMGDFLDCLWLVWVMPRYLSCLALADFDGGGLQRLRLVPLVLRPGRVRLAHGRQARMMLNTIRRRSAPGMLNYDETGEALVMSTAA